MRNRLLVVIFLFALSVPEVLFAYEEERDIFQIDDQLLQSIPLEDIETYWKTIQYEYGDYIGELTNKSLPELIKMNGAISISSVIKGLGSYLFYEILLQTKLLSSLLLLSIFYLILQTTQHAFLHSSVSKVANFIVYIVLIYITLHSFHHIFNFTKETISMMSHFMIALLPILLTLLVTSGQFLTASFFHPTIMFLIHVSGILMTEIVFPFLYLALLLTIVSQFNEQFQATQLAKMFKQISMIVISAFFTIFLTILSIQGAVTTVQDGLLLKTTKFLSSNIIPVIGRAFTEATDTFLFAAQLLKNGVGMAGLITLVLFTVFPLLKIIAIAFMYKVAAAIVQPLGKNAISLTLQTISEYMMLLFTCLLIVTFMFFISIVIMTVLSNIPLFLR